MASLQDVFSGTLTFLYRLMFVLYAESLDLLPVNEAHGYRELSLRRLKHEIAGAGGTLLDAAPDRIRQHYTTNSTALYDRLTQLFAVIDRGSADLNMPTTTVACSAPPAPKAASSQPTLFLTATWRWGWTGWRATSMRGHRRW